MAENEIREPTQKRSIEKKEKIIKSGFDLICEKGYYNTNTAEIAKNAGVSTGIVYQYFKDKHDILLAGIEKYAEHVFFPMFNELSVDEKISQDNIEKILHNMISNFVKNHKISETAHQEIIAMTHSDKDVAMFFQKREIYMTDTICDVLINNGFDKTDLHEKVHIAINLIDDLCHELVYHKHGGVDYSVMTELVIKTIKNLVGQRDGSPVPPTLTE